MILLEWHDGSSSQAAVCGGVCVADIDLKNCFISVVCEYSCHILKDRLASVVKKCNLVVEELLVASGEAEAAGTKLFH